MNNFAKISFFIFSSFLMISMVTLFLLGQDWFYDFFQDFESINLYIEKIKIHKDWFRIGSIISFITLFIDLLLFFTFKSEDSNKK